jgi:hypothetical protein
MRQPLMALGGEIMAAKVTLLNHLTAALRPEEGKADEIQAALHEWRVKALSVLLIVVVVVALPSYILSILNAIHSQQLTFPLLIYPIAYLTFAVLALLPGSIFEPGLQSFPAAYTNAVASFARWDWPAAVASICWRCPSSPHCSLAHAPALSRRR